MELHSFSALKNKRFSNVGAIIVSQSAVLHAARQRNDMVLATIAAVPADKCFGQHAPSVVRIPKCPLNLAPIDECIVAIVIVKSECIDRTISNLWGIHSLRYRVNLCSG